MGNLLWLPIIGVVLIIVVLVAAIGGFIYWRRYKTAASNQALIITGPNLGDPEKDNRIFTDANGRSMKIVRGGGERIKFFQTCTPLDLNSFQIQLTTPKIYTLEGVPVVAVAITSVKVADTLSGIAHYAEQYLGKKQVEIEAEVSKVLGTNLRTILAKLSVEQINNDRKSFNDEVQTIAQKELDNMGFKITSFGLDDLRDADAENGYLENLGRPRIAEVRKEADKAESNAEKETRMHRAKNDQEAQDEENRRQTAIAESQKEKDIKIAQIKEETERARAKSEASYELEKAKLDKEVKEEEMQVLLVEKRRSVELEMAENERRKTRADADAYDIKVKTEVEAEKARIDGETRANIEKAEGLAKAQVTREQGRAEAEIVRERGRAEAEIVLERGKADAEAKRLMAEAAESLGEVAMTELYLKMLPQFAAEVAAPLSNISEYKVIDLGGSDSDGGAAKITGNVTRLMTGIQESLKEATGMDTKDLIEKWANRSPVTNINNALPLSSQPESEQKTDNPTEKEAE